jgi:hypothetical protein
LSLILLFICICQQNWRKGKNWFYLAVRGVEGERGGMVQGEEIAKTMYAHMNK